MKSAIPIAILALFSVSPLLAQPIYYNQHTEFLNANKHWVFAHQAGLDFTSGTAVGIQSAIPSGGFVNGEGTAAVSDPQTGALLFYTDGSRCWNATGQVMPHGDSLLGNSADYWNGGIVSTTTSQGSCIVPVPGEAGKYYVFSMNYQGKIGPSGSLFYNVVDMSLDNTLGDVIPSRKNILLDSTSLSEAMVAVPGNNCDVWLVVHASILDTANNAHTTYRSYHITNNGINPNPVVSHGKVTGYLANSMSVSPGRDHIAFVGLGPEYALNGVQMGGVEVVKFDPNTGLVSDPVKIFSDGIGSHGCAFSPDNSKLYIDHNNAGGTRLLQYDITVFDSLEIATSKTIISAIPSSAYASLRLYNDTIYVAGGYGATSLGTINQPNLPGTACDYQMTSVNLHPGTSFNVASLPTEVVIPASPDTSHNLALDTLVCSGWSEGIILRPLEVFSDYIYDWQDQSSDTILTVHEAGAYWVRYSNGCHTFIDSFILSGEELIHPVIRVDEFELSTTVPYASYQWLLNGVALAGETNSTLTVIENGDYQVIVTNEPGCMDTSEIYTVTNVGIHSVHPLERKISVFPNPVKDFVYVQAPVAVTVSLYSIEGRVLQLSEQEKFISMELFQAGIYLLQVRDKKGILIKTIKLIKNP